MSLFDGKPIGRIDLNPRKPVQIATKTALEMMVEEAFERHRLAVAEGIWRAVRATAEGTNISTPTEDA